MSNITGGKASQKKGSEGELELAARLQEAGHPVVWGGNQSYGKRPDLRGLPGIHIECKRTERLNLHAAMKQAKTDASRFHDGFPTVFQRRTGEPWLVTMSLTSWLLLYDAWRATEAYKKRTGHSLQLDEEQCRAMPPELKSMIKTVEPPPTQKGSHGMKAKYWEAEEPIRVDTGRNILEYYPQGAALAVCRPNYEKGGTVYRGKSVALDVDALQECPEAVKLLRSILDA